MSIDPRGSRIGVASGLELPDKLFFKIGEVAKLAGVKQHVLRYWESEFPSIKPQKSKTNQRLYRRRDVEAVLAVKHLLYDRKFTVEGAREHLKREGVNSALPPPDLEKIKAKIRKEASEAVRNDEHRVRTRLKSQFQKDLLGLRQELLRFLDHLEKPTEE